MVYMSEKKRRIESADPAVRAVAEAIMKLTGGWEHRLDRVIELIQGVVDLKMGEADGRKSSDQENA